MLNKPTSIALKTLVSAALFSAFLIASCNSAEEKKEETTSTEAVAPAPASTDAAAPATTTSTPTDTAATKPVNTPN